MNIFEEVIATNGPKDRRFRMEHSQQLKKEDIPRFAENQVIASMQPSHLIDDGVWVEKQLGPERIKELYTFRSLLDHGATLSFGSDWVNYFYLK